MGNKDIASVLRSDRNGVELKRLRREFENKRDEAYHATDFNNRDHVVKAYDSGLTLLPQLWRLEQRR